jgi:hypothetical protein
LKNTKNDEVGTYLRLSDFKGGMVIQGEKVREAISDPGVKYLYRTNQTNFEMIPGQAIAYWASNKSFNLFKGVPVGDVSSPRTGLQTGNNSKFIRNWYEVDISDTNIFNKQEAGTKWFKLNTGGKTVKWYGNYLNLLYWKTSSAVIRNESFYFLKGISWKRIGSSEIGFKVLPSNFIFDQSGDALFTKESDLYLLLGFFNSKIVSYLLSFLAPTLNLTAGNISKLPYPRYVNIDKKVSRCIDLAKQSYDSYEHSWNFSFSKLLVRIAEHNRNWTVEAAFNQWKQEAQDRFDQLKKNEEELNKIFIDLYGLQDELSSEESDKEVSVRKADLGRDIRAFMSYFIGVTFGRYSLDTPGLAFAGGDWDASKYTSYQPNTDDVIVLTDSDYFGDDRDIMHRFREFLTVTFGEEHLEENLTFIAKALGKAGDTAEDQIRSYLFNDFYKNHLTIYQKRPIYWQLDSGRQGGFKALMYLHRYDGDTMAMIRTSYLHTLQAAYEKRVTTLDTFIASETNTRQKNQLIKQGDHTRKQLEELVKYDAQLQHVANMHIAIDLDDGVVVNHQKVQADVKLLTPIK